MATVRDVQVFLWKLIIYIPLMVSFAGTAVILGVAWSHYPAGFLLPSIR
jgi:hypothetical protein